MLCKDKSGENMFLVQKIPADIVDTEDKVKMCNSHTLNMNSEFQWKYVIIHPIKDTVLTFG